MTHWLNRVIDLLTAETSDLRDLARLAGGDPRTFYAGTDLRAIDPEGQDLSGMVFLDRSQPAQESVADSSMGPEATRRQAWESALEVYSADNSRPNFSVLMRFVKVLGIQGEIEPIRSIVSHLIINPPIDVDSRIRVAKSASDYISIEQSIELFENLVSNNENDEGIWLAYARELERHGRMPEALEVVDRAPIHPSRKTRLELVASRLLFRLNQPDAAYGRLWALIERTRKNNEIRLQVSHLLEQRGDLEGATKAILGDQEDPLTLRVRNRAIQLLVRAGRFDEAKDYVADALRRSATDRASLKAFLDAASKAGATAAVNSIIIDVMRQPPENPAELKWISEALIKLGDSERAIAILTSRVQSDRNPLTLKWLSDVLVTAGKPADAVRVLQSAVEMQPELALSWLWLGRLHADLADFEGAANTFRVVRDRFPERVDGWVLLGTSLARAGNKEALEVLREAGLRFPDSPRITKALLNASRHLGSHDEPLATISRGRKRGKR